MTLFDVSPFLGQDEGQFFDRKALLHGPPGAKKPRDRREVRNQVAEYVAGFANAEGGVLILGLDDDGTLSGHAYPPDVVQAILQVPRVRLDPPQAPGEVVEHEGVELLVFEVAAADSPVRVEGDGFPLRVGDTTTQVAENRIRTMKLAGLVESWESGPSALTLDELDPELLRRARHGAGLEAIDDETYLVRRKLAHRRGRTLVLRRAAELLFARDAPDHPNAGVRIFRVVGTERKVGASHNVEERPRVEGALPGVLDESLRTVSQFIRRPSRLVGSRFRETPEYPEFSWKEAVLNAIAHRDYGARGRTTEVWLFDDRMEVVSPGGLIEGLTIEELESQSRHHAARNPRIVRCLVDLGAMRDQGEGIPRMFAEMEALFLPSPSMKASTREFRLTLRNTPTLTAHDKSFVASLGADEFSDEEFRALLEASRHGRIDNARMRAITGADTLGASSVLRRLRDRGWLDLHAAGSASYYSLAADRGELDPDRGELDPDRGELDPDRGELDPDRGELDPDPGEFAKARRAGALPSSVRDLIHGLGARPRKAKLRAAISRLVGFRPMGAGEIATFLDRDVTKLQERQLGPMVAQGALRLLHPQTPTHPDQKYLPSQTELEVDQGEPDDSR